MVKPYFKMRCKNKECRIKFTAKYFLQKFCSKECKEAADEPIKQMNNKSAKREAEEQIYYPLKKAFLLKNPFCEICTGKSDDVHHKKGRNGVLIYDVDYFMSVCRTDHSYIHEHPKEAREKGWLI